MLPMDCPWYREYINLRPGARLKYSRQLAEYVTEIRNCHAESTIQILRMAYPDVAHGQIHDDVSHCQ